MVYHDTIANRLYYCQDVSTGFGTFVIDPTPANNQLSQSIPAVIAATYTDIVQPSFNPYTGEVLYINNINAQGPGTNTEGITRSDAQTEDIRIVIQLG